MVEIFFGLTDKHIENFERIVNYQKPDKTTKFRILITDKNNYKVELWDKIIISDTGFLQKGPNIYHDFYFMIKKIKAYKKIADQLSIYKQESKIRIYLAYIEDILANYLFFSYHKNAEFSIVEDGILNYYYHSFKNISRKRFYLKKALSSIFGLKYKKYKGHSSGIEYNKSKIQYLSFPNLAIINQKTHKIPFEEEELDHLKNDLFIIGQENLIQVLGYSKYKSIFYEFMDQLKKKIMAHDIETIYYKPRHKCLDFELKYIEKTFDKYDVKILNNRLLAEEDYFKNIKSEYIASMISSALMTIYSKSDKITKPKLKIIFKPIINKEISKFYEDLKFIKLGQ